MANIDNGFLEASTDNCQSIDVRTQNNAIGVPMKKLLLAATTAIVVALVPVEALAHGKKYKRHHGHEHVAGVGVGAVAGAVVAGPVGAVVGGVAGLVLVEIHQNQDR